MEILEWIEHIFEEYGYLVLLLGLPLDFIALPLPPGQTTLTYTGYLSYKGDLSLPAALAAAFAGTTIGITATYAIGYTAGGHLLERFGRRLGIREGHLSKTRQYYERYGNKLVFISFFLPGIRQFTGYFVGMIRIPFRTFAMYAYTGAASWVAVFVGIGYGFGEQWQAVFVLVERYLKFILIGLIVILLAYVLLKLFTRRAAG